MAYVITTYIGQASTATLATLLSNIAI